MNQPFGPDDKDRDSFTPSAVVADNHIQGAYDKSLDDKPDDHPEGLTLSSKTALSLILGAAIGSAVAVTGKARTDDTETAPFALETVRRANGAGGAGGNQGLGGSGGSSVAEISVEECPPTGTAPKFAETNNDHATIKGVGTFSLPISPETVISIYDATVEGNKSEHGVYHLTDGGKACVREIGSDPTSTAIFEVVGESSVSIQTSPITKENPLGGKYSITVINKTSKDGGPAMIDKIRIRALRGETRVEHNGQVDILKVIPAIEGDGRTMGEQIEISLKDMPQLLENVGSCSIISETPGSQSNGANGEHTLEFIAASVLIMYLRRIKRK